MSMSYCVDCFETHPGACVCGNPSDAVVYGQIRAEILRDRMERGDMSKDTETVSKKNDLIQALQKEKRKTIKKGFYGTEEELDKILTIEYAYNLAIDHCIQIIEKEL